MLQILSANVKLFEKNFGDQTMVIPVAVPGILLPAINAFGEQLTWENTFAGVNVLEAGFYGALRGGMVRGGRLVNWLRQTSIGYVNEIQTVFNCVNIGLVAASAVKFLGAVQERYGFSVAKDGFKGWSLKAAAVTAAVAGTVFVGSKLVDRFSAPAAALPTVAKIKATLYRTCFLNGQRIGNLPEEPVTQANVAGPREYYNKEPLEIDGQHYSAETVLIVERIEVTECYTVDITEERSTQQKMAKWLHLTGLVLNIATACFAKNRLCFIVSLAASGYSLWKNVQLNWIAFTPRAFPVEIDNFEVPVTALQPTYRMFALPSKSTEGCGICLDDNVKTIAFCTNHVFCKSCLGKVVFNKSERFVNAKSITKRTTEHYHNSVHTGTSHSYSIAIDRANLPQCPGCRDVPLQNTLGMKVTDAVHGIFNAVVTIIRDPVDRQYLFENLYAIYNTAQAGLAFLQTYPELAGTIYKIQKVLLVTDFIGLGLTAYYLYENVDKKFNPEDSTKFKVATVAAIGLTSVVSWYAMSQISAYLKSAIVLNDVLNQTGLAADVLKTLKVTFDAPLTHKVMQALSINRLIASTALTFFSEQKKTSLLSVAAQLANLLGISALKWIKVIQTLDAPLKQVVASGGKLLFGTYQNDVVSSQVTHHFLVSSSCLAHLQSTMKSIADFTVNFFNKSSWKRYWLIRYRNGVEESRTLNYAVHIANKALEACGCTLTPYLTNTSIKVVDLLEGTRNAVNWYYSS